MTFVSLLINADPRFKRSRASSLLPHHASSASIHWSNTLGEPYHGLSFSSLPSGV